MKFPLFLIVISFIVGIFLGGLVVFVITPQEKVEEVETVEGEKEKEEEQGGEKQEGAQVTGGEGKGLKESKEEKSVQEK